ncbi:NADPH-dependent 7-cyano-7-deazaguanine reductase QueF [bacterium]|nr:NADPH-dependent 7-cyano-7-deazaguanine reductase QueF [bacterium]
MSNLTDKIASKYLGKKVEGSVEYNPQFLVAIPRCENRRQYDIEDNNLPFSGADVWHAYEFSTLTANGIPLTRLLKLKYNCNSEYLVESKSLKLYLNSFNMTRQGETIEDCLKICKELIEKDLSEKLQTKVEINFLDNSAKRVEIFEDFENLTEIIDEKNLKIEIFKEAPELLQVEQTACEKIYKLTFDSLRSNCRVTHQPDFGDIFIYYKSSKHILEESLVKYLSSFRSEFHFHEECCEMIFKRLYDILDAEDELLICALYTRRGGIGICPCRYSRNLTGEMVSDLFNLASYTRYGIKQ